MFLPTSNLLKIFSVFQYYTFYLSTLILENHGLLVCMMYDSTYTIEEISRYPLPIDIIKLKEFGFYKILNYCRI